MPIGNASHSKNPPAETRRARKNDSDAPMLAAPPARPEDLRRRIEELLSADDAAGFMAGAPAGPPAVALPLQQGPGEAGTKRGGAGGALPRPPRLQHRGGQAAGGGRRRGGMGPRGWLRGSGGTGGRFGASPPRRPVPPFPPARRGRQGRRRGPRSPARSPRGPASRPATGARRRPAPASTRQRHRRGQSPNRRHESERARRARPRKSSLPTSRPVSISTSSTSANIPPV